MVRRFRNKVKISEVQEEFDKLCSRIDNLNQIITDVQGFGDDFDYSIGSPQVSPAGYTLTVGALQSMLNSCDGKVIGAKAFRVDANHIKMTTGMLLTKDGGFKLPDSVLTVPSDKRTLYYNTTTNQYQWTGSGTESVVVEKSKLIGGPLRYSDYTWFKQDGEGGCVASPYESDAFRPAYCPTYTKTTTGSKTLTLEKTTYNYYQPVRFYKKHLLSDGTTQADNFELSDDLKSIKFSPELYPNTVSFGILKNNSEITMSSPELWNNPTALVFGYYDPLTGFLTPKLVVDACTNGSGTGANILSCCLNYEELGFSIDSVNGCAKLDFKWSENGTGRHGDTTLSGSGYEEPTMRNIGKTAGILTFSNDGSGQYVSYKLKWRGSAATGRDFVLGSAALPFNIEDLGINIILLSSKAAATIEGDVDPMSTNVRNYYIGAAGADNWDYGDCNVSTDGIIRSGVSTSGTLTYYETEVVPSETAAYKICELNMNRDSIYVNDHLGVQCENIYGSYKIQSESRTYSGDWSYNANGRSNAVAGHWHWGRIGDGFLGYEAANNTTAPKFIVPIEPNEKDDNLRYEAYFSDKRISYNKGRPRGLDNWCAVSNFFFLPKGAPCPFNYKMQQGDNTWEPSYYNVRTTVPSECSSQKSYNVKISKTLKQKTS